MIKIAVCDDDNYITTDIEEILYSVCDKEGIPVDIDVFYSGLELEKELRKGTSYDLLYLDIQMKNGNGLMAANVLRTLDENTIIIFVSSYDKYMIELFRFDVFSFIKKPIAPQTFVDIFMQAYRKICNKNYYFIFHYKNEEYKIPCKEILYFESKGRQIIVHMRYGEYMVFNGKLTDVQKKLEPGKVPFLRIHQSFLVNYHLIKVRTKSKVTMVTDIDLPISEERQKSFNKEYGLLLGGELSV